MTTTGSGRSQTSACNGVSTAFAVGFRFIDNSDLKVFLLSAADEANDDGTLLTEGVHYTVSGSGQAGTAVVTTTTPYAGGNYLRRWRDTSKAQSLDLVVNGGMPAEALESQLDRLSLVDEELGDGIDRLDARALRVPEGETLATLPPAASRLSKVFGTSGAGAFLLYSAQALVDLIVPFLPSALKGDPGGNAMAIGAFSLIPTLTIPTGTDLIRTNEYGVGSGVGGAFYLADDAVDEAYAAAHPTLTAVSANGRGWRIAERSIDITQAGMVPGTDASLAAPNSAAVEALLAYLVANVPNADGGTPSLKVTAPVGHFRFAEPWVVKCALWLEGQSNSHRFGYATVFDFDLGGFQYHGPASDDGGVVSPATTGASGWRLENIACSSRAAIGTGHHGLHAVVRGDVIRCTFNAFPGDGIRIQSMSAFGVPNNNANGTRILFPQCGGNGAHGVHLIADDANCITTQGGDFHANGGFGIFDNAFLSNHHIGHHAEGNGLGLVFPGHKMGPYGACCTVAWPAWASGVAYAVINPGGQYRTNASKLYHLLKAGPGNTGNAPTHTTPAGAEEADGYVWAYVGTHLYCRYHTTIERLADASTTVPGTDPDVWVPFEFAPGPAAGIPLWTTGQTWTIGGSYCGNSPVAETVWEACYTEGAQPPAQIRSPQIWVGGQTAPSTWSTGVRIRGNQAGALVNTAGFLAEDRFYNDQLMTARFGADLGAGGFLDVGHPTRHPDHFYGSQDVDTKFNNGTGDDFITFTGEETAFTGGRSTPQPGVTQMNQVFLGAGSAARCVDFGTSAPASGHHSAGEIRFNSAPTAGGKVGWACTTAGTPGTWKAFGAIDP